MGSDGARLNGAREGGLGRSTLVLLESREASSSCRAGQQARERRANPGPGRSPLSPVQKPNFSRLT